MVRLKLMPEPVLQAADPAGEWVRWDDYAELQARADALEAALRQIAEHCKNSGRGAFGVDDRIVERCEDTARIALAQHGKVK